MEKERRKYGKGSEENEENEVELNSTEAAPLQLLAALLATATVAAACDFATAAA